MSSKIVIGIDEAGRGPLAGGVFAAAAIVPKKLHKLFKSKGITDSKKLTEAQRFELYELIKANDVTYAFAKRDNLYIDKTDILIATFDAMKESCRAIMDKDTEYDIMVDGKLPIRDFEHSTTPIIKGDSKILEISVASIIAKCEKDLEAIRMGDELPGYGFANHKGYGTKAHMEAIQKLGITKYHRMSFAPIKETTFSDSYREVKQLILTSPKEKLESIQLEITFNMYQLSEAEMEFINKLLKKQLSG